WRSSAHGAHAQLSLGLPPTPPLLERHELAQFRPHSAWRFTPISTLDDKSNVADRIPIVKPHALELVDRHRPISPGRVGEQHAVALDAPEDDKVIVAERIDRDHDRGPLDQVVKLELAKPQALV